jgi:hypothetical protein
MKTYFLIVIIATMLLNVANARAQAGYIIKVDGEKVYMNLPNAKVSDVVSLLDNGGSMTDNRTGRTIQTEPEVIGQIKIIAVQGSYSVGRVYGNPAISPVEGMTVRKGSKIEANGYGETTVMIAPASVMLPEGVNTLIDGGNDQKGYIGDLVSAELMNELLKCEKITVIDRSVLETQESEINLMNNGMIDQNTAFQLGKMSGARYIVQITLQKPDVEKVENNVPVSTILGGMAGAMGNNSNNRQMQQTQRQLQQAATYAPDIRSANIKVKVKIYTRVVDLQTGQALFQYSSEGDAKGKPQIQLEFVQLGFAKVDLNQNADFIHSVTGKAIKDAFKKIGKELNEFFERNINQ